MLVYLYMTTPFEECTLSANLVSKAPSETKLSKIKARRQVTNFSL